MPEVSLPSGLTVSCLQKHDVGIVNAEVQTYFDHNIRVRAGDTVVDVGANIGLFALEGWQRGDRAVRVFCFEPVAPIFEVLQLNLRRYDPHGTALRAYPFGLSNQSCSVEFAYYPRAPVLSTAYPDEDADLKEVKQATLTNIMFMPEAPASLRMLKWIPAFLRGPVVELALRWTLRHDSIFCELKTLSDVIGEEGLKRIDLLKVDAEKAELAIFEGIEPTDWPRIAQVVVDVHDIDGRLNTVLGLLRHNGFAEIAVEQPPTLIASNIYTVFAKRH